MTDSMEIPNGNDYEQLNAELCALRNQFRALSVAEQQSAAGKELMESIKRIDAYLKQQDEQVGVFMGAWHPELYNILGKPKG